MKNGANAYRGNGGDDDEDDDEEEDESIGSSSRYYHSAPSLQPQIIRVRSSSGAPVVGGIRSLSFLAPRINSILDLPFEMLQGPLSFLDIPSLERVSTVCSAFYSASRQSSVWMRYSKSRDPIEGRQLCKYRSGVRYDGLYISKCQYTRRIQEGASLTDNRQRLTVTYYRLVRFLPSGKMLMLRCEPSQLPTMSQLQANNHSASGLPEAVVRNLEIAKAANKPVKAAIDLLRDYDPVRGFTGVVSSKQQKIVDGVSECKWSYPEGDKSTLEFTFTDGGEQWVGTLGVEAARSRPGYRLRWKSYRYWSRRALAERLADERTVRREVLLAQLRRVNAQSDGNLVLADVLRDLERMDDLPEDDNIVLDELSPPPDLIEDIKLPNHEHFPPFRFKMFKQLSHLF
ncbi:F-box only protein 9 [Perkinsus chesapeaki]|uniref:F-box only protein 9 n=1 Tax=Perkinsus chesapeaki TaxID=330153 RepID=A0A7J6MNQ0_PERCH|nr:F-box only protein 9 [Perkinsus chesapeaki]